MLVVACGSGTTPSTSPSLGAIGDWPMYRGDLARDGHPPTATLGAEGTRRLKAAWQVEMSGAVNGTPAVSGGVVVAASAGGVVAAYRLASGERIWQTDGFGSITGSPTITAGHVFVGSLTGHVYALDVGGGKTIWDALMPGVQPAIWSSPTVSGQLVLVGIGSQYGDTPLEVGRVVALDAATGREVWRFCLLAGCQPGDGTWSSPAIDLSGHAFVGVGNPDDAVVAFDVATGRKLWMTSFHPDADRDVDIGATPVVLQVGGHEAVAVGSNGGVFKVLDAATGAAIWSRDLVNGSAVHGLLASPAYDGGTFFVPSAGVPVGVFALSAADGKTLWTYDSGLPIYSAPAIGSGVMVFGIGDVFGDPHKGGVVALSTRNGSVLWILDLHNAVFSAPAIAGETVLFGDTRGDLIAFRPG